jgi:hypothetical protein
MLNQIRWIAAFGCGMLLLLAQAAQAQYLQPAQPKIVTLKNFSTKGEYVGMSGGYMKCILDGTPVTVQFDPTKSKIKVTGTAMADYLGPGMYVQFKGTFNRFGKGTEPIKEVQIFTPDANNSVGAFSSAGNAFDESSSAGKKKGPAAATTMYQIAGKITAAHKILDKIAIIVDCGTGTKYKAEIAPDATVKLDSSDPASWASQGDKVTISGAILGPGRALGLNVSIELANPLTGKKKSHGGRIVADKLDKTDKAKTDKSAKTDKKDTSGDKKGADSNDAKVGDAKAGDIKKPDDAKSDSKKPDDKKSDDKKPDDKPDPAK